MKSVFLSLSISPDLKVSYSYFCFVWSPTKNLAYFGLAKSDPYTRILTSFPVPASLLHLCTLCAYYCARSVLDTGNLKSNQTGVVTTHMNLTILQWNPLFVLNSILPFSWDHSSLLPRAAPLLPTTVEPCSWSPQVSPGIGTESQSL